MFSAFIKYRLGILLMFAGMLLMPMNIHSQIDYNKRPDDDLGNNEDAFQELFFEALKQRGIENYQRAVDALLKAKQADDSKTVVYYELGKNYNSLKNFGAAENVLKEAVIREPDNEWYLDELYQVYVNQDDFPKAIKTVRQLVKYHPDYKQDLVALYIRAKDYKDALKLLDELDVEFGINPERDYLRNQVYTLTGNDEERIEKLVERLDKNPDNESNYLALIYRYSELGESRKAFDIAKKLLKMNPNSQLVHLALYKFYLEENDTQNAISSMKLVLQSPEIKADAKAKVLSDFVKFVDQNPQYEADLMEATSEVASDADNKSAIQLAQYYLKANEKEKALEYYKEALKSEPNNFEIIKDKLLLELDVKSYQDAQNGSSKALELFPAQPILYLINGVANININKYDLAIQKLEAGLDYLIDDKKMEIDFYKQLSIAHQAKNDTAKSQMYLKKADELQKDNQ